MILTSETLEAIEYINKLYHCYDTPDKLIRGMLRDFARNMDDNQVFNILKTETSENIVLMNKEQLEHTLGIMMSDSKVIYDFIKKVYELDHSAISALSRLNGLTGRLDDLYKEVNE